MNGTARLLALRERLDAAVAADDWVALEALDREIAACLPAAAASGVAPAVCEALRRAHRQARAHCRQAAARLGERLAELGTHREGWLAYALSGSGAEGGR
jgi:hypothetical protein